MITLSTPGPWHRATFVSRPNRFVVHATLHSTDEEVRTHLPDPGRLAELLVPGATVWLKAADRPRKTDWSTIYVESDEGDLVCCDTRRPNLVVGAALRAGAIDAFADWAYVRAETPWHGSRFDFLLEHGDESLYVEVKGVSWVVDSVARFPDAVTARGARHLNELASIARTPGLRAAALFILQRSAPAVHAIEPAIERDPDFASALAEAERAGVELLGFRTEVTFDATTLGSPVPVRFPPGSR